MYHFTTTLTYLILTLLLSTGLSLNGLSLNTYNITYEASGETIWRSTSTFKPQIATSYGEIRLGQVMSIEFDFKYEGRASPFKNQFFRIGAAAIGQGCNTQESKYPSMWLKYGRGAILDIQFSGDVSCQHPNYLFDYGDLNVNASHHIIISLNNANISIIITGGGAGKISPYTQTWPRDPTPIHLLGSNVSVWWMGDKYSNDNYDPVLASCSNIIIKTNLYTHTPSPTQIQVTQPPSIAPSSSASTTQHTISPTGTPLKSPTKNPTRAPTGNPSDVPSMTPTRPPTAQPLQDPSHSPTKTPTMQPTPTPTSNPTSNPTQIPTSNPSMDPTQTPTQPPIATAPPSTSTTPRQTPTSDPTPTQTIHNTVNPQLQDNNNNNNNINVHNNGDSYSQALRTGETIVPYTYIFYGALTFVAFLLIGMAFCCYSKLNAPKHEEEEEHGNNNNDIQSSNSFSLYY